MESSIKLQSNSLEIESHCSIDNNLNTSEAEKENALHEFSFRQRELIAGLNGIGVPVANEKTTNELHRALMEAKQTCENLGIKVQTFLEYSDITRKEFSVEYFDISRKEFIDRIKQYAVKQSTITPILNRPHRQLISVVVAVVVFWNGLSDLTFLDLLFAAVISKIYFLVVQTVLATVLPTPAIRVARLSFKYRLFVKGLYPEGSNESKDYQMGIDLEKLRIFLRNVS